MKPELECAVPIAEMFVKLLHPFAEVVIHDFEKDQIEAIYNSFSHRKVGDSSYLDRWDFEVDLNQNVIGPYEKVNYDGRRLKSISLVLRDSAKQPVGFLCVNMDVSVFETYRDTIQIFLSNNDNTALEVKQNLFKDDLYEQINIFVQSYCREQCLSLGALTRPDKQKLVLKLHEQGAFTGKNATSYIARVLNISRATVYNYLKEKEGGKVKV